MEKNCCLIVNLSQQSRGGMGLVYIEPDPQFLQPNADPQGRLLAKALGIAMDSGYFTRVGNELKIVADGGENVLKVFMDGQELILNLN